MPTLNWIGKDKVINHHLDVPFHTLDKQYTVGDSDSGNKIINGDNLVALKALLPEYEGKIKCIYIDPPYNTGNEGWIYNDNVNAPQIKRWLGQVVGKEGEDLSRHDKWLCMMYPRLQLLHKLLADDGAIFISIDDNEQANLKLLCDEIFGEGNFIDQFIWYVNDGHTDNQDEITNVHEYILCYSKNINNIHANHVVDPSTSSDSKILNSFAENSITKNGPKNPPSIVTLKKGFPCEIDSLEKNKHSNFDELIKEATSIGYITRDITKKYNVSYPIRIDDLKVKKGVLEEDSRVYSGWMNNAKLESFMNNNFQPLEEENGSKLKFYLSKNGVIYYRRDGRQSHYIQTIIENIGTTETNKYMLESMGVNFDYPKPYTLIAYLLSIFTSKSSIILDSFAGSGTTAHAVLNLNKKDGGNRKFILVEMEDYAETITAERVKRVINGYGKGDKTVEGTGGGFDYFSLGKTIFNADGNLNEDVGVEKIREYIWYSETGTSLPSHSNDYFLGSHNATDYYFYYEPKEETILTRENIGTIIKQKAEGYIIYADACQIEKKFMETNNITFKRIPRDIKKL